MELLACILEPLRNDEEFTAYRGQHRHPAQATRSSILLMSPLVGRTRFLIPRDRLSPRSRHRLMLSCRLTPSHPDMTVRSLILRYRQYQCPVASGYQLWLNQCTVLPNLCGIGKPSQSTLLSKETREPFESPILREGTSRSYKDWVSLNRRYCAFKSNGIPGLLVVVLLSTQD